MQPATLLARSNDLPSALAQLYQAPDAPASMSVTLARPAQLYRALVQSGPLLADHALLEYTPLATAELGASLQTVNTADLAATEAALQAGARWLLSTPLQEPYLTLPELEALQALCERYSCTLIVDQTLTPLLAPAAPNQGTLHHSLNLLTGQPEANGLGALCLPAGTAGLRASLSSLPSAPYPASGLHTLALRLRAHSGHAQAIADVLAGQSGVRAVYHPGLSTHPQFEYAQHHAQHYCAQGYGGVVYSDIMVPDFASRLSQRWQVGRPTLGGAHSALWTSAQRPHMYGLWAGLEDIDDLLTELEEALS